MKARARTLATSLFLVSLAAGTGAFVTSSGCAEKAPPPSSPEPVVIGVSLGLTGNFRDFASPLRSAIVVAEQQINAQGGVLGRPVRFDVVDDRSSEEADVEEIARRFVDQKVAAVIGPLGSAQVLRTQGILRDAGILQIVPAATSTELGTAQPENDRYLFRTTPADDFQGAAVMLLAERSPRGLVDAGPPPAPVDGGPPAIPTTCNKLAIVNIDNSYGNPMGDLIQQFWPKRPGRQIVLRTKIPKELQPEYKAVAAEVASLEPECLALISYDDTAAQFLRDFRATPQWPKLEASGFFFIGTDGIYTDGLFKNGADNQADPTSKSSADGVYGTNPDTQSGQRPYNDFRTLYASNFRLAPADDAPSFAANTYDAAILALLAIQRAGSTTDRIAIRDAMLDIARPPGKVFGPGSIGEALLSIRAGEDINYSGASGDLDFDGFGNVTAGFIVWRVERDGANKPVFKTVGRFTAEQLSEQIK